MMFQSFCSRVWMLMVLLWWCVLWPICGADDRALMVVPKEGQVLFDKLERIKVDAMADPEVSQGGVSKQEVIKVREALQKVFLVQESLPKCVIQSDLETSTTNTDHMAYGLYDILVYIYGKTGTSSSGKRRFAMYVAAYEKGILPAHLKVLDTAMYMPKSIRQPYLYDASFARAFAWLTGDMYADVMRPLLTCHDAATKLDPSHLTRLAPVVLWLRGQTRLYVPTGVQHTILLYAFGTNFGVYGRMCSVKEVVLSRDDVGSRKGGVLPKKRTKGTKRACLYQDTPIPLETIRITREIVDKSWVSEHCFPYVFMVRYMDQQVVRAGIFKVGACDVTGVYECVRFCKVYDVLRCVRGARYFDLLCEGWTEAHGLAMEERFERHLSNSYEWLKRAHLNVNIAVVVYLLGAFGTSKLMKDL